MSTQGRGGQKMAKFCPRSCWMTPKQKTSTLRMIVISYAGLSERRLIKFAEYQNFCLTRSLAYWRTKVYLCTKKKLSASIIDRLVSFCRTVSRWYEGLCELLLTFRLKIWALVSLVERSVKGCNSCRSGHLFLEEI